MTKGVNCLLGCTPSSSKSLTNHGSHMSQQEVLENSGQQQPSSLLPSALQKSQRARHRGGRKAFDRREESPLQPSTRQSPGSDS
ncbi:unnamed protein product [Rangifer tarandus platyrhynchus]|uniref:Uncharacterized protein n=2 Tax=Rangifer tarandus platyrhynchus TaxID=3082113 RepID=A0ABN8Y4D2_RANTA|nr:unnamed protein product [Rangifer tarandus platyrhynchus]CAI9695793.1 unnamed protein product [Rangifer tarandus platyrhynchus]